MPLLWLSLSFILGLALGSILPWPGWPWLLAGDLLALPALVKLSALPALKKLGWLSARHPRLKLAPLLLLAALAGGAWRYTSANTPHLPGQIASLNGTGLYRLTGMVSEPPDRRDTSTLLVIQVEKAVKINDDGSTQGEQPIHGNLLVWLPDRADWMYGERLELTGRPVIPPGASDNTPFSYRDYLAHQDIYSYLIYPGVRWLSAGDGNPLLAAIYELRERAYRVIYILFPSPEAPLLAGILLGIESDLPASLVTAFQNTGTAHIIAISGLISPF